MPKAGTEPARRRAGGEHRRPLRLQGRRLLHLPRQGAGGRDRDGRQPRARGLRGPPGLRAHLPVLPAERQGRRQLRPVREGTMSDDTATMPIEDYLAQGGVAHLAGQRPRPLPRRAPPPDGHLRRQRARRLRRLRRHHQRRPRHHRPHRRLPHHAGEGRPRRARPRPHGRLRRRRGPLCRLPHLGRPPAPRRLARPGPPRRRHAPRRLPLPDRGLDRRRRAQRPAGPRRRRDAGGDGAASPTPPSPTSSATSPRARSATPTSASPASPTSPPPRKAAPRRRRPSPTGSPASPTASAP